MMLEMPIKFDQMQLLRGGKFPEAEETCRTDPWIGVSAVQMFRFGGSINLGR